MAMADAGIRHRDALPSISHLDLDKSDRHRFPMMTGLNISTAPLGSPTTIYSGPPPPYSCSSSTNGSSQNPSGYISPPESTRRSTRDDKDSPITGKSLPSIQEALGEKNMPFPTTSLALTPTALSHPPVSAPPSTIVQSFPDAPKGPPNPFSQTSVLKEPPQPYQASQETEQPRPSFTAVNHAEPRPALSQGFPPLQSPRFQTGPYNPGHNSSYSEPYTPREAPPRSPNAFGVPRSSFTFHSQFGNSAPPTFQHPGDPFSSAKLEEPRLSFPRNGSGPPYSDSVKRHLEVFDAELALNEIGEVSARTLDFSRTWSQRSHQCQQRGYFPEVLPGLHEVDDMLRQTSRQMESLSRIREVVIAQQNAISEHNARNSLRGQHFDEDYSMHDEYKSGGGFAGGDAKKRRGKAAPPGRCHSCNRAETPEWRRGPDGARTLCNACGLHYAKLTRKMGVNKATAMAGSNLRPKTLDTRSPI